MVGRVGGTLWVVSFPHLSNARCKVPGRRMLDGVICPQSEDTAHVSVSSEPGERSLKESQWMEERGC